LKSEERANLTRKYIKSAVQTREGAGKKTGRANSSPRGRGSGFFGSYCMLRKTRGGFVMTIEGSVQMVNAVNHETERSKGGKKLEGV